MALFSVRAHSPLETLLRLLGFLLIAGLVALAFWKNGERNMERLSARAALSDASGSLSGSERERVQAFITTLKAEWGMDARVHIAGGKADTAQTPQPDKTDATDAKTLLISLDPARKTARVLLPPLLDRALGPDFAASLEREHFPFHFADGRRWQQGLVSALDLMEARLAALKTTHTPAPQPRGDEKEHK